LPSSKPNQQIFFAKYAAAIKCKELRDDVMSTLCTFSRDVSNACKRNFRVHRTKGISRLQKHLRLGYHRDFDFPRDDVVREYSKQREHLTN
jgi:hypothetical protein